MDHFGQHRPAPNDRRARVEEQPHGNGHQPVCWQGLDTPAFPIHLRPTAKTEHAGNIGSVDIGVEQADPETLVRQRHGEVGRKGGLADPALAAGNGQRIFNAGNGLAVVRLYGVQ